MNMAFIQSHLNLKESRNDKLKIFVRTIVVNYKRRRLYAQTISELNALSVRELSDLGLSRSMIRTAAYSAVYENKIVRENQN